MNNHYVLPVLKGNGYMTEFVRDTECVLVSKVDTAVFNSALGF